MNRMQYCALLTLAFSATCCGYEITTHALVTSKAYDASVLNPGDPKTVVKALGFDRLNSDYPFWFLEGPASVDYRDEAARTSPADTIPAFTDNYARAVQLQERAVLRALVSRGHLSGQSGDAVEQQVKSWLIRGAIREDDNDSLGHVVHLVEDAAQPKHVRNDAHAPPFPAGFMLGEGQADAAYEAFTDYRVIRDYGYAAQLLLSGNPLRRMVGDLLPQVNSLPPIHLGEGNVYPGSGSTVQFSTAAKFFTSRAVETGTDVASLRSRRGLADLSNRNFFTSGTLPGFRECQPPARADARRHQVQPIHCRSTIWPILPTHASRSVTDWGCGWETASSTWPNTHKPSATP